VANDTIRAAGNHFLTGLDLNRPRSETGGRFIDDSRDYIVSQALGWYSNGTKNFARWVEQERNAGNNVECTLTRTESPGSASFSGPQRDERGKRPRA
jgi:hypothetical protein